MSSKKKQPCTARDLLKDIANGSALSDEESRDSAVDKPPEDLGLDATADAYDSKPMIHLELDDLLDSTPNPLVRDEDDAEWLNEQPPHSKTSQKLAFSDIQASSTGLVRAADIDQLPRELREQFWEWMRGQTMPLIDGEPWVYSHDWQRFLRWYSAKTDRQPGRLAGKIQISDDFDDPI